MSDPTARLGDFILRPVKRRRSHRLRPSGRCWTRRGCAAAPQFAGPLGCWQDVHQLPGVTGETFMPVSGSSSYSPLGAASGARSAVRDDMTVIPRLVRSRAPEHDRDWPLS